jgi:hypothetical protein
VVRESFRSKSHKATLFLFLASSAVAYAPEGASRSAMIEAIGRGIGRAAVHEFAHLLLPRAPLHDSRDVQSYEYASAARREQYFGDMRWDIAWPLQQRRLRVVQEPLHQAPGTR